MAGPPLRPGAVQLTSRLVSEFAVAPTVGAPGVADPASQFTSVTVMVTPMLSEPPLPSETETVTA